MGLFCSVIYIDFSYNIGTYIVTELITVPLCCDGMKAIVKVVAMDMVPLYYVNDI